ncbi:MAG: heme ABC exporter ATP-binding protein CcmA [Proteobacteria bacterium]|nr:heme ABC exporter ATP-binding protein CcmA [Pseudomonadota bacterium]MDA1356042.1 heme ABC exporter ATP-binding protein CcmA [Pseudomonadota bacterium]
MNGGATSFEARELACIRGERPVFRAVSFALVPGDGLILRGPNGSGKSSLLRILAGFLKPVGGMIAWNGENIREAPEAHRAHCHYVGHLEAVKPTLTVAEHLAFWAAAKGFAKPADDILGALDLEDLADVPGRFLSAGQKRRLTLSRLLASPAALWLLDEPSITLDDRSAVRLEKMLADHRADGGMAIIATHAEIALPNAQTIDMAGHGIAAAALLGDAGQATGQPDYGEW